MTTPFESLTKAIKYAVDNNLKGNPYGESARSLLRGSNGFGEAERILEVGCGTGASTTAAIDLRTGMDNPNFHITATDQSESMIHVAGVQYDISDPASMATLVIAQSQLKGIDGENASKEFPRMIGAHAKKQDKVDFLTLPAHKVDQLGDPFEFVFANEVFHWFRMNEGGTKSNPNTNYETQALESIANAMAPGAEFAFSTAGDLFQFDSPGLNDLHFQCHPFMKAFRKNLFEPYGVGDLAGVSYLYSEGDIRSALGTHGITLDRVLPHAKEPHDSEKLMKMARMGSAMWLGQAGISGIPDEDLTRSVEKALDLSEPYLDDKIEVFGVVAKLYAHKKK